MADQIAIQIPKTRWKEGSSFTATAYFRNRATAAADTPATVKYRVDCLTTGTEILGWTETTAASNISLTIAASWNDIQGTGSREHKQLTIASDVDTVDQCRESIQWVVENLRGSP